MKYLKQYILFVECAHESRGGMNDVVATAESVDNLIDFAEENIPDDLWHIFNLKTGTLDSYGDERPRIETAVDADEYAERSKTPEFKIEKLESAVRDKDKQIETLNNRIESLLNKIQSTRQPVSPGLVQFRQANKPEQKAEPKAEPKDSLDFPDWYSVLKRYQFAVANKKPELVDSKELPEAIDSAMKVLGLIASSLSGFNQSTVAGELRIATNLIDQNKINQ